MMTGGKRYEVFDKGKIFYKNQQNKNKKNLQSMACAKMIKEKLYLPTKPRINLLEVL